MPKAPEKPRARIKGRTAVSVNVAMVQKDTKRGVFLMREDTKYLQDGEPKTDSVWLTSDLRKPGEFLRHPSSAAARKDFVRRQKEMSDARSEKEDRSS